MFEKITINGETGYPVLLASGHQNDIGGRNIDIVLFKNEPTYPLNFDDYLSSYLPKYLDTSQLKTALKNGDTIAKIIKRRIG